ncbi:MAG: NUDIX hydrolase [Pirellulales bacterium]
MSDTLPPPNILAAGKYLSLVARGKWEYAARTKASGAVNVVAVTPEGKFLMVEQFRVPLGRNSIELTAGLVGDTAGDENEALQTGAERELLEETGYVAARWEWLLTGPSSAGLTNEEISFFRAGELTRVHAGGGIDNENIVVHEIPLTEVAAWLKAQAAAGKAVDPKVYAGLFFALQAGG